MSELPPGWKLVSLGDIGEITSGVGFPPALQGRTSGDYPLAKVGDVSTVVRSGDGTIGWARHWIDEGDLKTLRAKPLPAGSIVFAKIGEAIRQNFRAITTRALVIDNNVMAVVPQASSVDGQFLLNFLRTEDWYPLSVATTVPSLRKTDLAQVQVPLPPLDEQRRIAAKLQDLLGRSHRTREVLDAIPPLLEKLRQSILAAAFRGDLTAEWRKKNPDVEPADKLLARIRIERRKKWEEAELAKMKAKGKTPGDDRWKEKYEEPEPVDASGLPELPEGWSWSSLTQLSWDSGYGTSEKSDYYESGPPVLRIPNVSGGRIDLSDLKRSRRLLGGEDAPLDVGDLLVVRTNGSRDLIGRAAAVLEPFAERMLFASYLIRFRLVMPLVAAYLAAIWDAPSMRGVLEGHAATSAGQYNVSMSKLSALAIPVPPTKEISALMDKLQVAEATFRTTVAAVADATQQGARLSAAILARAFRGELVEQDPSYESAQTTLPGLESASGESTRTRSDKAPRRPASRSSH